MFKGIITVLKSRQSSFVGTKGDTVDMFYVSGLTETGNVIDVAATKAAFDAISGATNTKFNVEVDVYTGLKGLKVKILTASKA